MKFIKCFNLFSLFILSVILFIMFSCKEGVADPHFTVFTTDNILKLQAAADKIMRENQTPGLIAYIAVEGEGELYITRGVGNLTTNEPMNPNNFFRMASVTKTFTTEAALILVDEGKIDLDKTISFYLPEFDIPGKNQITIRMLGNMTSGLIECLNDTALSNAYYGSQGTMKFTPEEIIVPLLKSSLRFTPGSQFHYCNTNTILLGLVIKKVTGKALKDVFEEKIFQPLGLKNTFWPETIYLPLPYHHAYTNILGTKNLDVTYYGNSWGNAAGILISNFADLKIWAKEISERKLLSANSKDERTRTGVPGSDYGFGVEMIANYLGHSGGIPGWNSMVFYNGDKKLTVIVHTNSSDGTPANVAFNEFGKILK